MLKHFNELVNIYFSSRVAMRGEPHWAQDKATHSWKMTFRNTTCWDRRENNWDSKAGTNVERMK